MLSFPDAWFDEECKAHHKCSSLQMLKMKIPNIVSISKNGKEKEEAILSNARKFNV